DERLVVIEAREEDERSRIIAREDRRLRCEVRAFEYAREPAGDVAKEERRREQTSRDERETEDDVGPDHRADAAVPRQQRAEAAEEEDDPAAADVDARRDAERVAPGVEANAARDDAAEEEEERGRGARHRTEAFGEVSVDGEPAAAIEDVDEDEGEEEPSDDEAGDEAQDGPVAVEGARGDADGGDGARLGRDDRERGGPPGERPPAEEVILRILLASVRSKADERDGGEVRAENDPIDRMPPIHAGAV